MSILYNIIDMIHNASWSEEENNNNKRKLDYREVFRFVKTALKIKIYIGTKTTFDFSDTKKFLFFNVKDFIFSKCICEIYILADIKLNWRNLRFL